MSTLALLERLERRAGRPIAEEARHEAQVALMRFLSDAARKLRVDEHTYVVGGAVRDFVIGAPIKDVDVVIDAVALAGKDSAWFAKQLQRLIPAKTKVATNQYGVAILTVTAPWMLDGQDLDGEVIEIANARKESYGGAGGKGYKPSAVAPASIEDDVRRREFTFNTLMWRLSDLARGPDKAAIIDLTGCGMRDLQAGEMRCPSDPDKTFSDDPTRMLRAIKFLTRYDWKIPPDVARSIQRNVSKLHQVPHEAVTALLKEVLKERTYKVALREMDRLGILSDVAEMMKTTPAMAAAMNKWSMGIKVRHLFDLLDVGLPIDKKVGFLTAPQRKRLREIAAETEPNLVDNLISILRQPGSAMKADLLIKQLGLKGPQIKELMHVARDVLLARPNLVGAALVHHTDSDPYTNAVRAAARERGIGEAVLFDVQAQLLMEEGADLEVQFFDFDNTLFKSPMQPDWWPSKRKWWSDPSSLSPPCVPDRPGVEWWNTEVVQQAKLATRNPNVYAVLLTGRHDRVFRWRVPELLKQVGLSFDEVHLAPGSDSTLQWKLGKMKSVLSRFPAVRSVHVWEDRDHIDSFVSLAQRLGFRTTGHRVIEAQHGVACGEMEWADVWK